jgi:hypothetical protein
MQNPYKTGDRVLVSRDLSGEEHVEGRVVDAFAVVTNGQTVPQVVVEFDPGDRQFVIVDDNVIQPAPEAAVPEIVAPEQAPIVAIEPPVPPPPPAA